MPQKLNIAITITLEAANKPIFEPPSSEPNKPKNKCSELWVECQNPYCFKHGCLNSIIHKYGEGKS